MSSSDSTPMVRVIVVNHNGGELTIDCLKSLCQTRWPADRLDIMLVDNGSTDGVAGRVRREVPAARVVEAGSNRGFAGGVNLGLSELDGIDHVAMLNNDATVDPGWLRPLVEAVDGDPTIGAASPKILFDDRFVDLEISAPVDGRRVGDPRALGVRVSGARVGGRDAWRKAQPVSGFWEEEHGAGEELLYRWTAAQARLRLPAPDGSGRPTGSLRLAADRPKRALVMSGPEKAEVSVTRAPTWHDIPFAGEPADIVNNVGSVLERGGYGANRGWLERDLGQFEEPQEVFAWCGAGALLSRRYVESVGLFDERFFLYYEDFDLSWRGRAQGWRYVYVPASQVRHVHTASSVEGSKLFQHYVERNRLMTLTRNAPAYLAATAAVRHLLVTASYARRDVVSPVLHKRKPAPETVQRRLRAFGAYARLLPPTLAERRRLRSARTVGDDELLRWMTPPRPDSLSDFPSA